MGYFLWKDCHTGLAFSCSLCSKPNLKQGSFKWGWSKILSFLFCSSSRVRSFLYSHMGFCWSELAVSVYWSFLMGCWFRKDCHTGQAFSCSLCSKPNLKQGSFKWGWSKILSFLFFRSSRVRSFLCSHSDFCASELFSIYVKNSSL